MDGLYFNGLTARTPRALEMVNVHGGDGQIFQLGNGGVQAVTQRHGFFPARRASAISSPAFSQIW